MIGRLPLALALIALAGASAGCDSCLDTTSCRASGASRLAVDGQLVRSTTGRGVDGVRVDVIRRGGIPLAQDSLSVVTSGGGFWHVESAAQGSGAVVLDFHVHAPQLAHPYVVAGRQIQTVDRAGDAAVLERWVVDPYLNYFIDLHLRPTGAKLASTSLAFHRRGTNWLTGPTINDTVAIAYTDRTGLARLFPGMGFFTDTGSVVGDLAVTLPAPYRAGFVYGLVLHPRYVYHEDPTVLEAGAGPSLAYAIQFFDRITGQPVAGVPYRAVRTGGIRALKDTVSGVTDASGYARPQFAAASSGTLVAALTVTPHLGAPATFSLTMPTFESDSSVLLSNFNIGACLNYAVQVFDRATGHPAAGIQFTATRLSGIAVSPTTTSGVTDAGGYGYAHFVPSATGTLTARYVFTPTVGTPDTVILAMPTFETDPGRLLANVTVGSYLNYYGRLLDGSGAPLVGVPVRVQSTGGVPVTPSDTTVLTRAGGDFSINPRPGAVGNAIVDLSFLVPAPYKPFAVRHVSLPTMQKDFPFGALIWTWNAAAPAGGPTGSQVVILP